MYENLRSPFSVGSMQIRNRMVMAPMGVEIVDSDGRANAGIVAYYEERARGGAGLIITENCAIDYPRGANSLHQLGLSDDSFIAPLRELTDRVHAHGGKIAVQLVHQGKISRVDQKEGRDVLVPSVPEWHGSLSMAEDLTLDEMTMMMKVMGDTTPRYRAASGDDIAEVTDIFAAATKRAREAGFDGIEIHGAHGYLLSGFLSKQWNRRDDDYGGSIENRSRFLCEVIRACRERVDDAIPVWCRLDALEYRTPDGIVFEDAEVTARLAQDAGAAAIHLSAYGDNTSGPAFTEGSLPHVEAKHAHLSQRLKASLTVPVIAVGRISPDTGERMIAEKQADLIGIGRQMLADPATAKKVVEQRVEDIRPCINCYVCVAQPFFDKRVRSAVNPVLSNEVELAAVERTTAAVSKRVVVIGGGPAGMEAARLAALQGHKVTLFESERQLGGTLRFAALVYEPNLRLLRWLTRQMDTCGVDVRLETAATPEAVRALQPDTLIVATGAARERSDIPGADSKQVMDGDDLRAMLAGSPSAKLALWLRVALAGARALRLTDHPERLNRLTHIYMPLGKKVTIIGGGLVGIEMAEFLVDRGRSVTVLESGPTMAAEMAHPRRGRVLTDLRAHGTTLITDATVTRITPDAVKYELEDETAKSVAADSVVIATGLVSDTSPADRFTDAGFDPVVVGDASGVGYIEGAIREGFHAALAVSQT